MDLNFNGIIQHPDDQIITLSSKNVIVIQTIDTHINSILHLTRNKEMFQLIKNPQFYKRLSVKEQLNFFIKWYDSPVSLKDILTQFHLLDEQNTRIQKLKTEMIQRLSFAQTAIATTEYVVAFNPFIEASNENIHLFHKLINQLKHAKRSLMVVTSRIEDAFIIQPNILTLKASGLEKILTESTSDEASISAILPSKLKVKLDDKTIFVTIQDIEYIESHDGKVIIMIEQEKFLYDSTLSKAEILLQDQGFYRCHRSYVVNLNKISEIINWSKNTYSIVLDNVNQDKIPLSRTKYADIQDRIVKL